MLVDLFRGAAIVVKFLFWDMWRKIYNFLIGKQNPRIKATYYRRIKRKNR